MKVGERVKVRAAHSSFNGITGVIKEILEQDVLNYVVKFDEGKFILGIPYHFSYFDLEELEIIDA